MTTSTTTRRPRAAAAAGTRKSPLRTATMTVSADTLAGPSAADALLATGSNPRDLMPAPELRQMQISEFAAWLRSRTNRNQRPFQEATIAAYTDAARSLDRWMTEQDIDADFTGCDTAMLNRFFTGWVTRHGQTGLNTRQRNLRHLFTWLEDAYERPHPYTSALHRYAPLKQRPSTLAEEFIRDLLKVTGGGRAHGFEDTRDHAMIRMLTEGVRRMELIQLELPDLSSDLIARPFVRVVPLKSARAFTEGRIVPLAAATSRSLAAYLRTRRSHRLASSSPALWLGTRNRLAAVPAATHAVGPGWPADAAARLYCAVIEIRDAALALRRNDDLALTAALPARESKGKTRAQVLEAATNADSVIHKLNIDGPLGPQQRSTDAPSATVCPIDLYLEASRLIGSV